MHWHQHYQGCGHNTTQPNQPPSPGNNVRPSVSIDMYLPFLLLCVAGFMIGFVVGTTNKKE